MTQAIEKADKRLKEIEEQLSNPEKSNYLQAKESYVQIDTQYDILQTKIQTLLAEKKKGLKKDQVKELEANQKALKDLTPKWETAKKDFDIRFAEYRTFRQEKVALQKELANHRQRLDELEGKALPAPEVQTPSGKGETPQPVAKNGQPPDEQKQEETTPKPPLPPHLANFPGADKARDTLEKTAPNEDKTKSDSTILAAEANLEQKQRFAQEAKKRFDTLKEELKTLSTKITLEKDRIATTEADIKHQRDLLDRYQKDLKNSPPPKRAEIEEHRGEAEDKLKAAKELKTKALATLDELQRAENRLMTELKAAELLFQTKQEAATEAQKQLDDLLNPFTVRNITRWLYAHGPKLLAIVVAMILLQQIVKLATSRYVAIAAKRSHKQTKDREGQDRAQTLAGITRYVSSLVIVVGGALMLMDEVGIPIVPLLGSAAVLGLAIAFGAQHLIRDYFAGFMILMEDQYSVNDVVQIGTTSGVVERITLRVTVLRDLAGVAHFIPHGTIKEVSNLTHSWSRAYFEIPVDIKEDVDNVMGLLIRVANELRNDAIFGPYITESVEMLGVDDFTDRGVLVKFYMRTRPLKQWMVKREYLRRIKRAFADEGIEIPFPHRMLIAKNEQNGPHPDVVGGSENWGQPITQLGG
ncbi:MAG: mechanosensitive ion channel domain-containing protein [Gemmataceae bacterium]